MTTLLTEVKSNSLLTITLHGVRTILEHELGIESIIIATDDAVKSELLRRDEDHYPYAHLEINELIGVKDKSASQTIKRLGLIVGLNGATKATTRKGYMFHAQVGMNLKYVAGDPQVWLPFCETMVILSLIGGLNFEIALNEDYKYHVKIEVPEQTAISLAAMNDAATPGGTEIEVPLIIHTQIGFFRDVAAVNSDSPIINVALNINSEDE